MDEALRARLLAPEHLMARLAQQLDLQGARLVSATPRVIDAPGYLSDLVGVTLAWDAEAGPPTTAVLKVSHAGFGVEELPFYQRVAAQLHCHVVPRFFAGATDAPSGRTWLLMEDLSASHERPSEAPLPPTFARSARIVEALAQFHAAGRDTQAFQAPGAAHLLGRLRASDWLESASERLFLQAGDALGDRAKTLYARWLRNFPALIERAGTLRGMTVAHGDAHVWNWMLPREGMGGTPKLIDWDGWHIGPGVWDLAYMMALQWDRDVRRRFEPKLLDAYCEALAASGVSGYPRAALQEDYRLAVLLHLRTPLARFARGISPYVWWPQLTRIQQAVEDHRCEELLG